MSDDQALFLEPDERRCGVAWVIPTVIAFAFLFGAAFFGQLPTDLPTKRAAADAVRKAAKDIGIAIDRR